MPGMIGMVDAGVARLGHDPEVVVGVVEHLRDREVGAGLLLGQQRRDVLRAGAAGGVVAARERRDGDRQRTDARAHGLRRAVGAPLRLDLRAAARPARRRSAGRRGAPPSRVWSTGGSPRSARNERTPSSRNSSTIVVISSRDVPTQVRCAIGLSVVSRSSRLTSCARGDARLARGAVGDRDEVRVHGLERLDGGPQPRGGVRVARREELERDRRPVVRRLRARRRGDVQRRACAVPPSRRSREAPARRVVRNSGGSGTSGFTPSSLAEAPTPSSGGGLLRRRRARSLGRSGW